MVSLPCLPATENSPCHSPSTGVKGSQFMTENKLFANNNKKTNTQKTASPDGIICYKKDRYFKDNSVCSHAATQPARGRGQCRGDGPVR